MLIEEYRIAGAIYCMDLQERVRDSRTLIAVLPPELIFY
jgi:hypothetical protein